MTAQTRIMGALAAAFESIDTDIADLNRQLDDATSAAAYSREVIADLNRQLDECHQARAELVQRVDELTTQATADAARYADALDIIARHLGDTFVIGRTRPTVETTGPRPGAVMGPRHDGVLTIDTPGLYAGLDVVGGIDVTAPNVVIRDSRVTVVGGYGVRFTSAASHTNALEHVRIAGHPDNRDTLCVGVRGSGYVQVRTHITGVGDGRQVYTTKSAPAPLMTESYGCLTDDLTTPLDPGQADGLAHTDGDQHQGNGGSLSVGCRIVGGRTSCIIATTDISTRHLMLAYRDGWLEPHDTEGSGVNVAATTAIPGLSIVRNVVARTTRARELRASLANRGSAAAFGMVGTSTDARTWTAGADANRYPDGTPVPVING